LAVVSCYFNPAGYQALKRNYLRFVSEFSRQAPLYIAEVAFEGDEFLTDAFVKIRASRERHCLWQKERLLNLVVERLPSNIDAVAWVDADVTFFDPFWFEKAIEALGEYHVCQLFDKWHFSNSEGQIVSAQESVGLHGERYWNLRGHPGGAWAARREVFPMDDTHILGGGDSMAIEGWLGICDTFLQKQMNPDWFAYYRNWADKAFQLVMGNVTSLNGHALHWYHGERKHRHYAKRSQWLADYHYDPERHIQLDANGLYAWSDAAPSGLVQQVQRYFYDLRKEDE
jgi:hypothetical protein